MIYNNRFTFYHWLKPFLQKFHSISVNTKPSHSGISNYLTGYSFYILCMSMKMTIKYFSKQMFSLLPHTHSYQEKQIMQWPNPVIPKVCAVTSWGLHIDYV